MAKRGSKRGKTEVCLKERRGGEARGHLFFTDIPKGLKKKTKWEGEIGREGWGERNARDSALESLKPFLGRQKKVFQEKKRAKGDQNRGFFLWEAHEKKKRLWKLTATTENDGKQEEGKVPGQFLA